MSLEYVAVFSRAVPVPKAGWDEISPHMQTWSVSVDELPEELRFDWAVGGVWFNFRASDPEWTQPLMEAVTELGRGKLFYEDGWEEVHDGARSTLEIDDLAAWWAGEIEALRARVADRQQAAREAYDAARVANPEAYDEANDWSDL